VRELADAFEKGKHGVYRFALAGENRPRNVKLGVP